MKRYNSGKRMRASHIPDFYLPCTSWADWSDTCHSLQMCSIPLLIHPVSRSLRIRIQLVIFGLPLFACVAVQVATLTRLSLHFHIFAHVHVCLQVYWQREGEWFRGRIGADIEEQHYPALQIYYDDGDCEDVMFSQNFTKVIIKVRAGLGAYPTMKFILCTAP